MNFSLKYVWISCGLLLGLAGCGEQSKVLLKRNSTQQGPVNLNPCAIPLNATLTRLDRAEVETNHEVIFKLQVEGCSGSYSFEGISISSIHYIKRVYTNTAASNKRLLV